MNIFDRDYAIVYANGQIGSQSHSRERLEQLASELRAQGIACDVVKSDCPRRD